MKKILSVFEEVQLVYRNKTKAENRPKVRRIEDAYDIFISSWDKDRIGLVEEFKMLMLDRANRFMSISTLFVGGLDGVIIDPKIIFATALKRRCNSLILAHNHPSGTLKPSLTDITITKQLVICGNFLELPVYDHIILSENGFYSLNDEGFINSVKIKSEALKYR